MSPISRRTFLKISWAGAATVVGSAYFASIMEKTPLSYGGFEKKPEGRSKDFQMNSIFYPTALGRNGEGLISLERILGKISGWKDIPLEGGLRYGDVPSFLRKLAKHSESGKLEEELIVRAKHFRAIAATILWETKDFPNDVSNAAKRVSAKCFAVSELFLGNKNPNAASKNFETFANQCAAEEKDVSMTATVRFVKERLRVSENSTKGPHFSNYQDIVKKSKATGQAYLDVFLSEMVGAFQKAGFSETGGISIFIKTQYGIRKAFNESDADIHQFICSRLQKRYEASWNGEKWKKRAIRTLESRVDRNLATEMKRAFDAGLYRFFTSEFPNPRTWKSLAVAAETTGKSASSMAVVSSFLAYSENGESESNLHEYVKRRKSGEDIPKTPSSLRAEEARIRVLRTFSDPDFQALLKMLPEYPEKIGTTISELPSEKRADFIESLAMVIVPSIFNGIVDRENAGLEDLVESTRKQVMGFLSGTKDQWARRYSSDEYRISDAEKGNAMNCLAISIIGNAALERLGIESDAVMLIKYPYRTTDNHMVNGIRIPGGYVVLDFTNNVVFRVPESGLNENFIYETDAFPNAYMTAAYVSERFWENESRDSKRRDLSDRLIADNGGRYPIQRKILKTIARKKGRSTKLDG